MADLALELGRFSRPGDPRGDSPDWLRVEERYAGDLEVTRWEGRVALTPTGERPAWEAGAGMRHTTLDGEVALLPRGLGRRVYNGEVRVAF